MQPTNNHSALTTMLISRVYRPLESNALIPVHAPLANAPETRITLYGSRCGLGMLLGVLALLGKSSYRVVFDAIKQLDAVGCYNVLCQLQCLCKPRHGVKIAPWDILNSNTNLSTFSTASTSSFATRGSATKLSSSGFLSISDTIVVVAASSVKSDVTSTPVCTQVMLSKTTWGSIKQQQAQVDDSESWGHFVFLDDE